MNHVIDYYFAPVSPWAYLGHARVGAIAKAAGATVRVRPVHMNAVFAVSGGLPLARRPASKPAVLSELLAECGLPAELAVLAQQEAVDARLDENTRLAIEGQVFGSPSYVLDGEIFWGQDRLEFLREALAA